MLKFLMSKFLTARISVRNDADKPRAIWLEPLAEDFTLLPGEELEIVARDKAKQPWFALVERPDSTQVYVEGTSLDLRDGARACKQLIGGYQVLQGAKRLECGHNRKAGLDAGLKY
jgi:hypothetical protein